MKKFLSLLLLAAILFTLPLSALAKERGREPLHNVNLDQSGSESFTQDNYFKARWITVSATIQGPAEVQVQVSLESNNKVVFSEVVSDVNGAYLSPEIYLEFVKSETIPYRVELFVNGEQAKNVIIHRMLLELNNNNVTTRGIRFREYDADITDKWFMFTPINFETISPDSGTQVIDLIGSNMYVVGKLTILRSGDNFMLSMQNIDNFNQTHDASQQSYDENYPPDAPVIADHQFKFAEMYIAMYPSLSAIESVEHDDIPDQYKFDTWYSITDNLASNPRQILYLNGIVSYDPNSLERIYDNINSSNTRQLVDMMNYMPE